MRTGKAARLVALAAGLAAACALTGCHGVFFPVALVAAGTPFAVGASMSLPHGPTVTVDNQSDQPVKVRLWVARVDVRKPGGFDDRHTGDAMTGAVPGGEVTKFQGGDHGWPTGQNDGIVWVRLDAGEGVRWFALERPGPYRIEVRRADTEGFEPGPIEYLSVSGQKMTALPEHDWIEHHDGRYPITTPEPAVVAHPAETGS